MRIGINCVRIMPTYKGGVNSFTFGLLDGFAASGRDHSFVIFASPRNREMFRTYEALPNFRVVEIDGPITRIGRGIFNRIPSSVRFRLPHRLYNKWLNARDAARIEREVDVQYVPYCPTPIFPFPATPTVYSIHDLQHVHFPEFFTVAERRGRDVAFANCVRHAALIQATSKQMWDEFLAHFPSLTPDRLVVIPEGVDLEAFSRGRPDDEVRARYGLPERFLFYPAQLWHHKNHIVILKALARLKERGIKLSLVLTGARYSASQYLFDFIEKNGLSDRIFYLGLVPYEDIIALHRAARFMIATSLYESASIPILEAAAAGTPIIGSETPSYIEQSGDLQMQLFPPHDDIALADLLASIWDDDDLIARQSAFNKIAVQQFTWNNAAKRYLAAFLKLDRMSGSFPAL